MSNSNIKKIIIMVLIIIAIALIILGAVFVRNKIKKDRNNSIATYQLDTSSAWSIKYNKNPNFKVELIEGNAIKIEAIGSRGTVKVTCSNEKNEEIIIKATYDKDSGIKITKEGESSDLKINLKIGEKNFTAILYNNGETKSLKEKLPLTITMNEKNGNEKYCYLDNSLPTNAINVGKINTGDIMLYQSNCLAIFYDTFDTEESYTKIGYIEDVADLREELKGQSVKVEISVQE